MFSRETAGKYVNLATKWILERSESFDQFIDIYESIYTGEILTKNKGAIGFIKNQLKDNPNVKYSLGTAKDSYSLSSMFTEMIFNFAKNQSELADTLSNIDNELDFSNPENINDIAKENPNLLAALAKITENQDELIEASEEHSVTRRLWSLDGEEEGDQDPNFDPFLLLKNNPRVKKIADMVGRLVQIYDSIKRTEPGRNKTIASGILFDNYIPEVFPEEFLGLVAGVEELELLFYKNYVDRMLISQNYISKEEKGKGPIYMFVDRSGSMGEHNRIDWAFSMVAALCFTAKSEKQKRPIFVDIFNTSHKWLDFTGLSLIEVVQILADIHPAGGTDINPGLSKFIQDYPSFTEDNKRGDIIILTDGHLYIDQSIYRQMIEFKQTTNLHIFSIFIGASNNKQISDLSDFVTGISSIATMSNGNNDYNKQVIKSFSNIHSNL